MKRQIISPACVLLTVLIALGMITALSSTARAEVTQATNSDGFVNTFISEPFFDEKITDEETAEKCVMSVIDSLGGSKTTELELDYIQPNETGMTVVSFSQRAGQMLVYGSTVKLIVDKDDNAIGLVSSISPDVEVKPIEEWAVSDTQAEKIVMDQLAAAESGDTLVEGATERAVIPHMALDVDRFICVWVVYTYDMNKGMDDYAYTAHYVSAEGEYLYSVSVSSPSDPDATSGQTAKELFDFDAYEPGETQVTINMTDGSTKEVTVPTLKDPKTGKTYLADAERKILCGDVADMFYKEKLTPVEAVNVDPVDAHVYYNFIRVWDYYRNVGWEGPDGKGTPSLLLMNYVDEGGNPIDNACYLTKTKGFQVFAWSRHMDFGGCLDIVGHEFTHCVTTNTMKYNIYKNDTGAINEAYSDIMGSLIEIRLDGNSKSDYEGAWKIGENCGSPVRNMADPHEYAQPAFAFDTYYSPCVVVPTEANDKGGVHTNSSLLALCAVKLDEAGMTPRDQSYFWINSALVISPQTDYPMMAKILPWVMQQLGYDEYIDTLNKTIEEAKFTATEPPAESPAGCGAATFDFTDYADLVQNGRVQIIFFRAPEANPTKRAGTWPVIGSTVAKATLPAGDYYVLVGLGSPDASVIKRGILGKDGWKFCEDRTSEYIKANGVTITVNEGKTTVVPDDTFRPVAAEILKIVDPDYVLPDPKPEPKPDSNPGQDISKCQISGIKTQTYTGKALTQNLVVSNGSTKLVMNTDYTVSYENNINVGTATVIIKGMGNYTGTVKNTFNIVKAGNPIKVKTKTKSVKAKTLKKNKKTTIKKAITVSKAKGAVSYKITKAPKAVKKLVKINSKGVITFKKWTKAKKGTCKLSVTVSAKGTGNYKSFKKTYKVKIKIK